MSLKSLLINHLEAYGLPLRYLPGLSSLLTSDIITFGLRLALIGLLAAFIRARVAQYYTAIQHAHIGGVSTAWIASYLAHSPDVQRQLKHYRVLAEEENENGSGKKQNANKIKLKGTWSAGGVCATILPIVGHEIKVRVNGSNVWLSRQCRGYGGNPQSNDFHYLVRTWFWNERLIKMFLVEAYKLHHEKTETELHIYNHTPKIANWEGPTSRPSRPWSSVILPGSVKDDLLKDVKEFISEEEKTWYTSKGIPHRRGYLLHGPPGTGKTTLATALASSLRLDLYCVNPAAPGMDNAKLQKCFRNCPPGSMLLIEDIDCVMPVNRAIQRNGSPTTESESHASEGKLSVVGQSDLGPSTVTLSGLLNAIDGVSSQEDSVLFASTNYIDKLDEALRRPGRFDVHIAFDYAVHQQAADLYKHFYPLSRVLSTGPEQISLDEKVVNPTQLHCDTEDALNEAADQFAESTIGKGIKVSVATMQGYLLLHKKDPKMALDKAGYWADKILKEQTVAPEAPQPAVGAQIPAQ